MAIEVGDAVWRIKGDTSALDESLNQAERNIRKTFLSASRQVAGVFATAGAAITGILGKAAYDASQFGAKVANLATLGVKDLKALEEGTRDLAVKFGIDLNDAIDATYEAISAGIPEDAAIMVMEQAARGAQAGVGSLGDALDLGTSVLNAWNLKGADANATAAQMEKIMGMAATAAFKGKTTFAQMATSIGLVAPVTAAAGVGIDEFFAALAGLTATGLPTSSAMAQLQQMISNVIKPSSQAAKLAEELGLKFDAEALASKGLAGFLDSVKKATGGNVNQMGVLFGSVEALGAAISLTGNQAALFKDTLGEMGGAQATLTEMQDAYIKNNPALAFAQVKSSIQSLFVEMGQYLLPAMVDTAKMMNKVISYTIQWLRANPELATQMLTIAKNIGYALIAIGAIVAAIPTLIFLFDAISWPVVAAGLAIGAIVGVLAAATYAISEWLTSWLSVPENMTRATEIMNSVSDAMGTAWNGIVGVFRSAVDAVKGVLDEFNGSSTMSMDGIVALFKSSAEWIDGALAVLGKGVGMAFGWISGILASAVEWISANWEQISQIFSNAIDGILLVGGMLWEGLKLTFSLLGEFLSRIFGEIGEGWKDIAGVAGDESKTWLDVIQIMQEKTLGFLAEMSKAFERFTDFVYYIWPVIAAAFEIGTNLVIEPLMNMLDTVYWVMDQVTWLIQKLGGAWDWIAGASGFAGGVSISGPQGMATGGTVNRSGWAVVGERGPELVQMPQGATVYDAQQSAPILQGGGTTNSQNVTVNFNRDSVRSDDDIRQIERVLTRLISTGMTANGTRAFA